MEEQRGKEGNDGALWVIIKNKKHVAGKNGEQKHFVIVVYNLPLLHSFFSFFLLSSFLVLTKCMLVLVVLFYFFLLPIHTTRQMMFSQNPETSKIRFLDSGFSPVSANSRIALRFDLRPSMNDRSK